MSKRDLLRKLRSVHSAERGIVPDQAWVLRTRGELMQKIRTADALAPLPASLRWREAARTFAPAKLMSLMRAPALAALSVIGAVMGGSLMGVNASERSLPGDFLYPIKLASEQTRLALTSDKADRVRLKTEFVDRRVEEIKTIVKAPEKNSGRVREAAMVLKRDLDTVKNQLKEVKQEASAPKAAELAKLVDQKSVQVTAELDAVKDEVALDAKSAVAEAQAQAVQTGVAAVAVLIEANEQDAGEHVTSDEEVAQVLQNKVDGLRASIEDSAERVRLSTSGTLEQSASGTTPQIATASSTLGEVKVLLDENKLGLATDKLAEAAKATVQAEVSADLLIASSTAAIISGAEPLPTTTSSTTSTTALPTTSSTTPTASSTPTTPPPK
ncbi:DUF5667 domain-containing protein [Patescibacteria group bacterium]|jgi:hypothetical protein|nr:DUF5667 domain-containing protein [Patescibacteria group bacterium]